MRFFSWGAVTAPPCTRLGLTLYLFEKYDKLIKKFQCVNLKVLEKLQTRNLKHAFIIKITNLCSMPTNLSHLFSMYLLFPTCKYIFTHVNTMLFVSWTYYHVWFNTGKIIAYRSISTNVSFQESRAWARWKWTIQG